MARTLSYHELKSLAFRVAPKKFASLRRENVSRRGMPVRRASLWAMMETLPVKHLGTVNQLLRAR